MEPVNAVVGLAEIDVVIAGVTIIEMAAEPADTPFESVTRTEIESSPVATTEQVVVGCERLHPAGSPLQR
jgi:hypothetical protein